MLKLIKDPSLPRLAWIAEYDPNAHLVTVHHGNDVETGDDYVVEGVWDGPFANTGFDESQHFFGSGLKLSKEGLVAVPATSLVDRIFIGRAAESYYISNSLIEILARTESELVPDHNYRIQTDTIRKGFRNYITDYPVASQILQSLDQFFYNPVAITHTGLAIKQRPASLVFEDFDHYLTTIKADLQAISLNARSSSRRKGIGLYTTISKGYDSPAVSALVADLPIVKAFTSKTATSPMLGFFYKPFNDDDGTSIAHALGLNVDYLDFKKSEIDEDELYFLAATTGEPELQLFKLHKLLKSSDNPSAVFTGYHGDTVWATTPPKEALRDDILKPGASGLTLSEVRLKSGFIDIPVPMMHARSIVSINKISNCEDMTSWWIRGDYNRPIPRRILECAGIDRQEFGTLKRAVATFYDTPKNRYLKSRFLKYMRDTKNKSLAEINIMRINDRVRFYACRIAFACDQTLIRSGKISRPLNNHTIDTPYYMHFWALSCLIQDRKRDLDDAKKAEPIQS